MQPLEFKRRASVHWPNVFGISLAASGLLIFLLSRATSAIFLVCGLAVLVKSEITRRTQKEALADCQTLAEWKTLGSIPFLHVKIRLTPPKRAQLRSWSVGIVAAHRLDELCPERKLPASHDKFTEEFGPGYEFPACHDEFAWVTTALEQTRVVEAHALFEIDTSLLVPEHLGSAAVDPEETVDWSVRVDFRMDRLFTWTGYATIPAPPLAQA